MLFVQKFFVFTEIKTTIATRETNSIPRTKELNLKSTLLDTYILNFISTLAIVGSCLVFGLYISKDPRLHRPTTFGTYAIWLKAYVHIKSILMG